MLKTILVVSDIEDGERAVSALENSGLRVTAAFWSPSDDHDDWYLVIISPDVAEKGASPIYKQAFETLKGLALRSSSSVNFWQDRIKILSPASLIYRNLKQRAGTGDRPVRPGWAVDSYIYKMD